MISISRPRLASRSATLRSTAVHELAHAIFDMPVALGGRTRKIIRTVVDGRQRVQGRTIDWPEWRVGGFMGAFIVPLDRLANAVARQACAICHLRPALAVHRRRWRCRHDRLPRRVASRFFGVSPAFMAVRLKKGGFVAPHIVTFQGRA